MNLLKKIIDRYNQKQIEKFIHLNKVEGLTNDVVTPQQIKKLLVSASTQKSQGVDSGFTMLCATLELMRYLIKNKNMSAVMGWLIQQKEIDNGIKSGLFTYLESVRNELGGESLPLSIKAD